MGDVTGCRSESTENAVVVTRECQEPTNGSDQAFVGVCTGCELTTVSEATFEGPMTGATASESTAYSINYDIGRCDNSEDHGE